MRFVFKAKTKEGELREGTVDAVSSEAAAEVLQKNNLFPVSLRQKKGTDSLEGMFLKFLERVNRKELVVFFRQLSILIEARVPIVVSLATIREQMANKYFKKVIEEMTHDIQDGLSLSEALKKHQSVFSALAINIIKAGEVSGNLSSSVLYVAENIEKNYTLAVKVRSAMTYPAIILIVFFIIGFLIISFVVPNLLTMVKELGVDMPWHTTMLIVVSDFMSKFWWAVLLMIFGFAGGVVYYIKTDDGRKEWDQIKIKLPIFGRLFKNIYITRFADNLGTLLTGGIPIIRALTVVSSVTNNTVFEAIFLKAADEVKKGGTMSDVFKKYPLIPPIVAQMVRIGEESGQVDMVLKHVAKFYERETDEMTKNLTTLIEPVLMVIIGAAVGFLAFSVLMPIYNIAGQL